MNDNNSHMKLAINEAENAFLRESVPVGAVIISCNTLISSAGNEVKKRNDPTAHAEILAIQEACKILKTNVLDNCDMYVTLEPCAMCAQAISLARIRKLYFGAYDIKYGAVDNGCKVFNYSIHKPEIIGGIFETQCAEILQKFFQNRRK
jgi:cytosine deaminase